MKTQNLRIHAVAPFGQSKSSILKLALDCAPLLKLNKTAQLVLRRIFEKLPTRDFHCNQNSPVCYERQCNMADSLQMSRSTFSRAERALEKAGLIARITPSNGFRGRTSSRGVKAGLSLAPLIMMIPHLEAERQTHLSNLRELNSLRMEIRILRRRILSCPIDVKIKSLLDEFPRASSIRCLDIAKVYLRKLAQIEHPVPEKTDPPVVDNGAKLTAACVKTAPPHKERWSRYFGPFVKVDRLTGKTI